MSSTDIRSSSPKKVEGTLHKLVSLKAQPGSHHHFSDSETVQLATFVNARFADEPLLKSILPVDGKNVDAFFDAWANGKLLIVLVDAACEGVVDLAPLRRRERKPLSVTNRHLTIQHFAVLNNALQGCKDIEGLRLGFVGAEDFVQGNRPVILGVGWQLVRLVILQNINILEHPELGELFTAEEKDNNFGHPGQEELVLSRWFNQYLQAVGSDRQVWSFGVELADGVAWCTLLNAIDPASCPPPEEQDPETNAINIISAVENMGIKGVFITEEGLMDSDRKQNVMFCAQIMEKHPTVPSYLRHTEFRSSLSKRGAAVATAVAVAAATATADSSRHSKGSSTATAPTSMYTSSPGAASRDGGPPDAVMVSQQPSPPKTRWGFGRREASSPVSEQPKVYYDSDGEAEEPSNPSCGFGFFSCVIRS